MGDRRKKQLRRQQQRVARQQAPPADLHGDIRTQQFVERSVSLEWYGPLPPPHILRAYHFIHKGPDRLLKMAERQAKHRRKLENRASWTEAFQRIFGSVSAFVIAIGGLGGAVFLIYHDKSLQGLALLLGPMAVLIAAVRGARVQDLGHDRTEVERQDGGGSEDPDQMRLDFGGD